MTLVEHLTELRRRVIIVRDRRSSCSPSSCSSSTTALLHFLSGPYEQVTRGRHAACGATATTGCKLIATGPLEPFLVRLKVSTYGGIALVGAVRVLADLAVRHARACTRTSAATASAFLIAIVVLFVLGARRGLVHGRRRRSSSCSASGGSSIQPFITADKYLTLVTLMIAAFGVAFEFPVLLVFLLLVRVVNTRQLRSVRRWMIVGIVDLRGGHHPEPGPVLPILHGCPHVPLLRDRDRDRTGDETVRQS